MNKRQVDVPTFKLDGTFLPRKRDIDSTWTLVAGKTRWLPVCQVRLSASFSCEHDFAMVSEQSSVEHIRRYIYYHSQISEPRIGHGCIIQSKR